MKSLILLICCAALSLHAGAQDDLRSADLKAAFCVEPMKNIVAILESFSAPDVEGATTVKKQLDQAKYRLDRVKTYLQARAPAAKDDHLRQILIAIADGQAALKRAEEIQKTCQTRPLQFETTVQAAERSTKCMNDSGLQELRLKQCADISFLPY